MRLGIDTVIIPLQNEKHLADIPEEYRKKITFIPVRSLDEVLSVAIIGWEKRVTLLEKEVQGDDDHNDTPVEKTTPTIAA